MNTTGWAHKLQRTWLSVWFECEFGCYSYWIINVNWNLNVWTSNYFILYECLCWVLFEHLFHCVLCLCWVNPVWKRVVFDCNYGLLSMQLTFLPMICISVITYSSVEAKTCSTSFLQNILDKHICLFNKNTMNLNGILNFWRWLSV